MKNCFLVFGILSLLFTACEENKEAEDLQSDYILAGVETVELNINLFSPELKIDFINEKIGDIPTTGFSGDLYIDLNSDSNSDIQFHAFYGYSCSMAGCFSPVQACELMTINSGTVEIYGKPLSLNDTINSNLDWEVLGSSQVDEQIIFHTQLSSFTPAWANTEEIRNNEWLDENQYLAIRMKKGDIYKFGWIRLRIEDYYDLILKETGFEK
ncbi:MAG: hypothetical protein K9H49_15620 [Bacteroidales bacterium]|nr:hypothetical protein [Bacteroidales bacterium]MCF8405496.1 hypothetical protein [Bacteroidales bacterium]